MLASGGTAREFTIINYNVHSLINFEIRMELFLQEVGAMHWDLVVFTETWREEKSEAWETHEGHTWLGSGGVKSSCGVGFLLHKRWKYNKFKAVSARQGVLEVSIGPVVLSVFGIYMPHGARSDEDVEAQYYVLESAVKSARAKGNRCVVAGDFNAEVGSWREGDSDSIVGRNNLDVRNDRGQWLVAWATLLDMTIANTFSEEEAEALWTFLQWLSLRMLGLYSLGCTSSRRCFHLRDDS